MIPHDVSIYEQAFTHASYTNEHKDCPSYDRLEFLGDSLLDMIVGDLVYQANPSGSFIAAVYLDQGYDFVRQLLIKIYSPLLDEAIDVSNKRDSKSRLQEMLKGAVIQYVVIKQENLNSENVCFTVEARYGDVSLGIGKGHNTKEAEINAASDALSKKVGN